MAKPKKPRPKEIALIKKLKPESFGEFASMCFAKFKPGGSHGAGKQGQA